MRRVFVALLLVPGCVSMLGDPAPGFFTSIAESRRLVCEPTTLQAMRTSHPGLIEDARPRGDYADRAAMECAELVLAEGERSPADRAMLGSLEATTTNIARQLAANDVSSSERTWLVESHYPNAAVASKITFAAKAALVENGLTVTDRAPPLAVGDIDVISRTPPIDAHVLACRRYFATGKLGEADAVLGLLVLDRRETSLHAGTCVNGRWTWLR